MRLPESNAYIRLQDDKAIVRTLMLDYTRWVLPIDYHMFACRPRLGDPGMFVPVSVGQYSSVAKTALRLIDIGGDALIGGIARHLRSGRPFVRHVVDMVRHEITRSLVDVKGAMAHDKTVQTDGGPVSFGFWLGESRAESKETKVRRALGIGVIKPYPVRAFPEIAVVMDLCGVHADKLRDSDFDPVVRLSERTGLGVAVIWNRGIDHIAPEDVAVSKWWRRFLYCDCDCDDVPDISAINGAAFVYFYAGTRAKPIATSIVSHDRNAVCLLSYKNKHITQIVSVDGVVGPDFGHPQNTLQLAEDRYSIAYILNHGDVAVVKPHSRTVGEFADEIGVDTKQILCPKVSTGWGVIPVWVNEDVLFGVTRGFSANTSTVVYTTVRRDRKLRGGPVLVVSRPYAGFKRRMKNELRGYRL